MKAALRVECGACALRPYTRTDAPALVKHGDDREVWKNLRDRFPSPYTIVDARRWVAYAARSLPDRALAIEVGGEAVGGIGLDLHEDVERCGAEVGYWLGRSLWGRGIATAALVGMTRYGFEHFPQLERIWAVPFADNAASIRVLEKAGYQREGVLRRSAIKDGVVHDQLMMSILRT